MTDSTQMRRFKKRLRRWFLLIFAVLFLIEAWLWDVTGHALGWILKHLPIEHVTQWIRLKIHKLTAWQTLAVFAVPVVVLLPFKFLALAMLAHGHLFKGVATIIFAKLCGLGITSFLFAICKPKLLQLRWMNWLYMHCLKWRDQAHELVKPYTRFIKRIISPSNKRGILQKLRVKMHAIRKKLR